MPTISMFYGILVSLFFEDNERLNLPHIHVRYQGAKASIINCHRGRANSGWSIAGQTVEVGSGLDRNPPR